MPPVRASGSCPFISLKTPNTPRAVVIQVLVSEAGGVVKAIDGGEYRFHTTGKSNIVCGNAAVIPEVVEIIEAAHKKMWKKVRGDEKEEGKGEWRNGHRPEGRGDSVCLCVCVLFC